MKVKLVKNVPYIFGYIGKDAEVDLPDKDAKKLVEAGYAELPVKKAMEKASEELKELSSELKKAKPSKKGKEV